MASYTSKYRLKKPSQYDAYDVDDFNGNFDTIDTKLSDISDRVDNFSTKAQDISVADTADYFKGSTVEDILAEVGKDIKGAIKAAERFGEGL